MKKKKYILQKITQQWLKENDGLIKDIDKLSLEILLFELKWGVSLGLSVNEPKEIQGRWTSQGIIELIDEASKKYNKPVDKNSLVNKGSHN